MEVDDSVLIEPDPYYAATNLMLKEFNRYKRYISAIKKFLEIYRREYIESDRSYFKYNYNGNEYVFILNSDGIIVLEGFFEFVENFGEIALRVDNVLTSEEAIDLLDKIYNELNK